MEKRVTNILLFSVVVFVLVVLLFFSVSLKTSTTITGKIVSLPDTFKLSAVPPDFTPTLGYYHAIYGIEKKVVLWQSNVMYESTNGLDFTKVINTNKISLDLPADFVPKAAFYVPSQFSIFGVGGGNALIDATGKIYFMASGTTKYQLLTNMQLTTTGLPTDLSPAFAYYHAISGGRVTIYNKATTADKTGFYVAESGKKFIFSKIADLAQYNVPQNPNLGYYMPFTIQGISGGTSVLWQGANYYVWDTSTDATFKGPNQIKVDNAVITPSVGYFDTIRNKVVLWQGRAPYESSDGVNFVAVTGVVPITTCTDTDGKNYETRGTVKDKNGKDWNDECTTDLKKVTENFCNADGTRGFEEYTCPNGCSNGACVSSASNLVSQWKFDVDAKDALARNDGEATMISFVNDEDSKTASGKMASFDGVNGYITVKDSASLDITNKITASVWIEPTVDCVVNNCNLIEKKGGAPMLWTKGTANPYFGVVINNQFVQIESTQSLAYNKWTNIVGTYDGAQLCIYVNKVGNCKAQLGAMSVSDNDLLIGKSATTTYRLFKGFMDNVKIFNTAISQSEIDANYNNENPSTSTTGCTDTDTVGTNGKNYNVKGTGSGWNTDTEFVGFYDTCYQDTFGNLVNACSGTGCYLAEKYCEGKYVRTELSITCPNGCSDGACVSGTQPTCAFKLGINVGETVGGNLEGHEYKMRIAFIDATKVKLCVSIDGGEEQFCDIELEEGDVLSLKGASLSILDIRYEGVAGGTQQIDICLNPSLCIDSDGGNVPNIKGTVYDKNKKYWTDECVENNKKVIENFCNADGTRGSETINCANGCKDGACTTPVTPGKGLGCAHPTQAGKEVPPRERIKDKDGKLKYCSPLTFEYSDQKEKGADCLNDYECKSNSCIDNKCISLTEEMQKQASLLWKIWCWVTNFFDASARDTCIAKYGTQTQTCKDYDNGKTYNTKSNVLITEASGAKHWYNDACTADNKKVYENYCDGNNWKMETYACSDGCSNGACISSQVPTTEPVAYYKFDGNANDAKGTNNGVVTGAALVDNGISGKAYEFDGNAGKYINVPISDTLKITSEITVSAWIKPKQAPTGVGRVIATTYYWNSDVTKQRGWLLGRGYGSENYITFEIRDASGAVAYALNNGFFANNLNKWTHVVGVFKGGQFTRLYINGVLANEDTTSIPSAIAYQDNIPLRIGSRADNTVQGMWSGTIDEIRIYNKALTIDGIKAIYDAEKPATL